MDLFACSAEVHWNGTFPLFGWHLFCPFWAMVGSEAGGNMRNISLASFTAA